MTATRPRIFAGWWVVAGAFLCMFMGYTVAYSFAAFFGALESEFGARRGETSLVFSIAAFLDGLFFVVRAGKTSIRFAKMGINTIHQRGAPMLGIIVNGVPIDNPYYYYTTYYYASYYHRPLTPDASVYPDKKDGRALATVPGPVDAARGADPVGQKTGPGPDKV